MSAKTWISYAAAAVLSLALLFSGQILLHMIGLLVGISVVLVTVSRFQFRIALGFGILVAIVLLAQQVIQYNAGQGTAYEIGAPVLYIAIPGAILNFVLWSLIAIAVSSLWRLSRRLLRRNRPLG